LSWYLCVIRVLTARAHNDYNINPRNTSCRTSLCILVILNVKIRIQIIQNTSKLKYYFNAFAFIFQCYSCPNGSRTQILILVSGIHYFKQLCVFRLSYMLKWDYKCHKTRVNWNYILTYLFLSFNVIRVIKVRE
jgi:hypothetical protein